MPPLNVCLEVNINGEPSKSGILVEDLNGLARQILNLPRLQLRGLMVIPEPMVDFQQQLLTYKKVHALQQQLIGRVLI